MEYNSKTYAFSLFLDRFFFRGIWEALGAKKGEKVLEVGCNRGALVKKMRDRGIDAVGIDVNPEAVSHALVKEVQLMDATNLEFKDNTFDKLYSVHTLEHIPDVKKAIQEMARVVRPRGEIVCIYPAEPGFLRGIFALKSAIMAYGNPLLCRKIHMHSLTPKRIQELIQDTLLMPLKSEFPFLFVPQYLTILQKKF